MELKNIWAWHSNEMKICDSQHVSFFIQLNLDISFQFPLDLLQKGIIFLIIYKKLISVILLLICISKMYQNSS